MRIQYELINSLLRILVKKSVGPQFKVSLRDSVSSSKEERDLRDCYQHTVQSQHV